ncbi:uncharacterized protein NPIL_292551 [Nephila pilipes]|uniref:Optineurin n=1 Tax=Nephila pilipes TaxID=299642 RepID=A0A8X6IFU3_NEPPI|nr:uncharacterized protein NPIL_292551 [Nephila pilipes]
MTSLEASPPENGLNESLDTSEFCLISEQSLEDGEGMVSSQFDLGGSFPTQDITGMEFQKRLVELVEDNESMKEALKWNNAMMKDQLHTISEWHNMMTTSLSQQRVSLEEAKLRIQELEKENAELRLKNEKASQSDNKTNFETVQTKKLQEDVDLKNQLKEAEDKIIVLQKELNIQKTEIGDMKALHETKEQEKIVLEAHLKDQEKFKSKYEDLLLQFTSYQNNSSQNYEAYEQQTKLLSTLKESVEKFETELEGERAKNLEANILIKTYQANYERVDKLLQVQSKDEKEKREHFLSERELEARRMLEQIDGLTAKLFDLEQQLEEKEEKLQLVTMQLETFKRDSESIPILKAQVDVYKSDLNGEKETSQKEIERLTQQLTELQSSPFFCVNCGAQAETTLKFKARRKPSTSRQEVLLCPVCQFGFKDVQSLTNHVNNCLDKTQ